MNRNQGDRESRVVKAQTEKLRESTGGKKKIEKRNKKKDMHRRREKGRNMKIKIGRKNINIKNIGKNF